jgi:LacI family transcriptional regulator
MNRKEKIFKRVSQQDIAREAKVSRVTVSLVLAGKDQTSTETRNRVLEVAKRLKYRPNLLVQGMQSGRTGVIGLMMPPSMHFHGQIARGIHDELVKNDYVPIQLWTDPSPQGKSTELSQIHRLVDRRVDGVIIFPADASVPDVHYREIWERNIPLVTVDRETTTHADHVGTDEELGGQLVAEHLLKLGHRRFAHLSFINRPGSLQRRRESFLKAIKQAGGECKVYEGDHGDFSRLALQLLQARPAPTAVFCATDLLAMKVYSAAAELGLKIPDDCSVVGYADFPFAEDLVPPLTTVRQDPYNIGTVAAKILLDRVLSRTSDLSPRKLRIKPEAIIRKSTARPNPA